MISTGKTRVKKICVLGLGGAGVPLSAIIALKCPEIRVTFVQTNSDVIFHWNTARIPPLVYIPGLEDIIRKCLNRNLFFSHNKSLAIKEAEIIFIASESTLKKQGEGEGQVVDLSEIEEAAHLIAEHAESNKIVVDNSSIPLKAAECVENVLNYSSKPQIKFQVLSNPEFYTRGSSLRNFLFPNCVLIGNDKTPMGLEAANELASLYKRWVPSENIIISSNWSTELSRLCTLAMIFQTLTSLYALAWICEESEGNYTTIVNALPVGCVEDLKPVEFKFNLGNLLKDIQNLLYMCERLNLTEVADYWREVLRMYKSHQQRIFEKFFSTVYQSSNKKVAILGFAYYRDTHITECSWAIDLCKELLQENTEITIFDPRVQQEQVIKDLISAGCKMSEESLNKSVSVFDDPYKTVFGSQVIVMWTHWEDFAELDFDKIYKGMVKPAYICDYTRSLPHSKISEIGFNVQVMGHSAKDFLSPNNENF